MGVLCVGMVRGGNNKALKKVVAHSKTSGKFNFVNYNYKFIFTDYIEKVLRCTRNVVGCTRVYEYEYMTHDLYEYE